MSGLYSHNDSSWRKETRLNTPIVAQRGEGGFREGHVVTVGYLTCIEHWRFCFDTNLLRINVSRPLICRCAMHARTSCVIIRVTFEFPRTMIAIRSVPVFTSTENANCASITTNQRSGFLDQRTPFISLLRIQLMCRRRYFFYPGRAYIKKIDSADRRPSNNGVIDTICLVQIDWQGNNQLLCLC